MTKTNLYKNLPETPGVYFMKNSRGEILYIGKAGNLKRRVSSYFLRPHDARIERLVQEIARVSVRKTDTAIEALILESALIKKHKPPYNIREKDDKSFLYVEITRSSPAASKGAAKEKFPRVLMVRGKSQAEGKRFGPFTSPGNLREALHIIRRIFPFSIHAPGMKFSRPCFDYEVGLCPGTCVGAISRVEYMKHIRNLALFFQGEKKKIIKNLEKAMKSASKDLEFEKAAKIRGQLFALRHIQDVALITESDTLLAKPYTLNPTHRIEGYDISNISGTSAVGSMVVFVNGKPNRNEYRKFRIKIITQSNDVGMMKEVLRRRFARSPSSFPKGEGWPLPNLILVDGGKGQIHAAKDVLSEYSLRIPVIGIAKGPERKRNDMIGILPRGVEKKTLIAVRDEAHRFAISYHKTLRRQAFFR